MTSEFIKFDDDDQGNTDGTGGAYPYGPSEDPFNLKIYYCYYEPGNAPPLATTYYYKRAIQYSVRLGSNS